MEKRFRYKGLHPFEEEDNYLFFGRQSEIQEISKKIKSEKITILYSKPGFGKTSLINAGLIPELKKDNKKQLFSVKFKNYNKNTDFSPIELIYNELDKIKLDNSYLDKVVERKSDLWIKLKKIQSHRKDKNEFIIFIDQFENLFTYPNELIEEFKVELYNSLYSQIPENYKQIIQEKVLNNPDFLTNDGFKLLYKELNLRILIGIRDDFLSYLNKFNDLFQGILSNSYELPPLSKISAIEAIIKPAEFEAKYQTQNNFTTKKFTYSEDLLNQIIISLTDNYKNPIQTFQLQIICENIEKIVMEKSLEKIELEQIGDINALYKNYYEKLLEKIEDENQRKIVRVFIEDELILKEEKRRLSVYQGVALNKHKITETTLDILVNSRLLKIEKNKSDEIFYEVSHDALVNPIIEAKNRRIETQIRLEEELKQQAILKDIAEKERLKVIRNRKITGFVTFALAITMFLAIYALNQKKKSDETALISKSNLLASYAYQELSNDPTLSLRLAQEAYKTDKDNSLAYSTLINAFYETNVFYNIKGEINEYVEAACISNDGSKILFIANDFEKPMYKVLLTDLQGNIQIELKHTNNISSAVFSPDGQHILTACWDSIARIWDFNGSIIKEYKEHETILNSASYSNTGEMLVTTGNDYKAIVWGIEGNKITELLGHNLYVRSAEFSPDDKYIVTSAEDNSARIWDLTGKQLSICIVEEEKYFFNTMLLNAKFTNKDYNILLVSNAFVNTNHTARLFDFYGNELVTFRGHEDWVNFVDITENDDFIITTSKDNNIIVWDKTGNKKHILKGHKSSVFCAKFVEDNSKLISVSFDGTIREWTINQEPNLFFGDNEIEFATFSPTGIYAIGVFNNSLKICDLLGETILNIENDKIKTAYISNDYKNIITTETDSTARIYDFTGKLIISLTKHTDKINTAVFSPDNQYYLTASDDKTAILWNNNAEIKCFFLHNKEINTAFFSNTGNYIITSSNDSTAKLWKNDGKLLQTFAGHNDIVTSASISPDENYIITTGNDATARLWSISGEELVVYKGYENSVNSAEFSPDGKFIMTTSNNQTAVLWDLKGLKIMVFKHEGNVKNATFSPNGKYILSLFRDEKYLSKSKLWLVNSDEICKHVDELKRFGDVWKLDEITKKQYKIIDSNN